MGKFLKKSEKFWENGEDREKKWLKGGNGATIGSEITHSPTGEQNQGCVNSRANLTRSRGDAEDVREGL